MRELSAGIHNLQKCTKSLVMTISILLNLVETSDEALEANLCTVLQSIRGSKQYWFTMQSELRCMICKCKLSGSTVPDQPKAKKHIISKSRTSTSSAKPPKSDS